MNDKQVSSLKTTLIWIAKPADQRVNGWKLTSFNLTNWPMKSSQCLMNTFTNTRRKNAMVAKGHTVTGSLET